MLSGRTGLDRDLLTSGRAHSASLDLREVLIVTRGHLVGSSENSYGRRRD